MFCCEPDFSLIISSDSLLERQISSVQGPGGSEVGLIEHTSALPSQLPAASTATGAANHASTPGYICTISNKGAPITIPVHGVVLAAASPYFETLLRDWKSSSNSLQMIVSEDQIPAAQVLLSFMYTSTVPAGLSQHDLLQLLLLADRFDVRRAAAAASRVLGCLSPAALEWATLTGVPSACVIQKLCLCQPLSGVCRRQHQHKHACCFSTRQHLSVVAYIACSMKQRHTVSADDDWTTL